MIFISKIETNKIYLDDCLNGLKKLPDNFVNTCVTSPPYWGLRDYGVEGQLGLESNPEEYVEKITQIFNEVKRVLKEDGTLWLNLGDTYNANYRGGGKENASKIQKGNKGTVDFMNTERNKIDLRPKNLVGIPWRVAFALQENKWYLRSDIIWHKPNCMPESVQDRPTKSHEYIFLLSKSEQYYYDIDAIREPHKKSTKKRAMRGVSKENKYAKGRERPNGVHPNTMSQPRQHLGYKDMDKKIKEGKTTLNPKGRNKRTVWKVSNKPLKEAHFAAFPPDLIEPCILAGAPEGGIVLDPFMGAGTTALVAYKNNRKFIGFELNQKYINIAYKRLGKVNKKFYQRIPKELRPKQKQFF
jgi:DNA modification methylase